MRKLILFLGIAIVLLSASAAWSWWVDPSGLVWKPDVLAAARKQHCLVSEELIGSRYWSFKRDVFSHRPTRRFVVGSSRVLKMGARPREESFSNLGYPGSSPETILQLFRSLPARPRQTVDLGVEAFWLNKRYTLPETNPSKFRTLEYLLAWSTFHGDWFSVRQAPFLWTHRWKRDTLGPDCVLDKFLPALAWKVDGSRVWGFELAPKRYPKISAGRFTGDLTKWRNGYYADWHELDPDRINALEQALALARARGWTVVGFAPPEPPAALRLLNGDPRLAPQWHAYLRLMPKLFARYGFRWADTVDGAKLGCRPNDFPDGFHSDARCSQLLRRALDRR
jgi:hypothetical protein